MNFKDKYCADIQKVLPSTKLLADTENLLQTPPSRRQWRWAAAALLAAALVCAVGFPLMSAEDLANQPTLLCDQPDIAAYQGSETVGIPSFAEEQPLGRSAMQPRGGTLTIDKDYAIGVYLDQIPKIYLTAKCINHLLPNHISTVGVTAACREFANFKIFY